MLSKSNKNNNILSAIAIIVGTCIGAGIFGLPYVISRIGVVLGVVYLIVLAFVALITTLAYGEVVLRTKGTHQFTEYVHIYLGSKWKKLALFSFIVGFYGALIAYLIESSNFLFSLLSPYFGGNLLIYRLGYFAFVSIVIFFGLGMIAKLEKIMIFAILSIIVLLIIFATPHVQTGNLISFNLSNLLLPYGVILFAFASASAVPDMKNILGENKAKLKLAILIGILIPLFVYIIFSVIVVGICGATTTESAVDGLAQSLGPIALTIGAIFGILTMTTSYLALSLVLREVYEYDLKINKLLAWAMVVFPPLIIVLLNFLSFIEVIGISGAVIGGIDGLIMIHMFKAAKNKGQRKPEYELKIPGYFTYVIYLVFIGGIAYECYMVFNKFFT